MTHFETVDFLKKDKKYTDQQSIKNTTCYYKLLISLCFFNNPAHCRAKLLTLLFFTFVS